MSRKFTVPDLGARNESQTPDSRRCRDGIFLASDGRARIGFAAAGPLRYYQARAERAPE